MMCPACTADVRHRTVKGDFRYYACQCGERWKTMEIIMERGLKYEPKKPGPKVKGETR
jgi:hypothetical protein